MAEQDIRNVLDKLRNSLSKDELATLQSHVDVLESAGSESHHETTSHHHTSHLLDLPDILGLKRGGTQK